MNTQVIGNNSNATLSPNVMNSNSLQLKNLPGTTTSVVGHGIVGTSSSHHIHSPGPLNLTLKSVIQSVNMQRQTSSAAQASSSGVQSGDMHCTNSTVAGSSNGQQHALYRKQHNVQIMPPTHSSIRNLTIYQMSNKNNHSAAFNSNGALQSKQ